MAQLLLGNARCIALQCSIYCTVVFTVLHCSVHCIALQCSLYCTAVFTALFAVFNTANNTVYCTADLTVQYIGAAVRKEEDEEGVRAERVGEGY